MRKTSRARIMRILQKHCVMVKAEFLRPETDNYGDVISLKKYGDYDVYFSQLLHRYNPYVGIDVSDLALQYSRHTPMAIVPYTDKTDIREFDILRIEGKEYTISFFEDVKGFYCLLSLSENNREEQL